MQEKYLSYQRYLSGSSDDSDYGGADSNYKTFEANNYNYTSAAPEPSYDPYDDKPVRRPERKPPSPRPRQPRPQRLYAPDTAMKRTPPSRASVIKIIFIALSALALLFTLLYGNVQTNKLYRQIADKNAVYEDAKSENARLKSELEGRMTLKNVQDYAERVLKLQKLDNSQIKYVQTQKDDTVEIVEEDTGFFGSIKRKFMDMVEYIFG